MTTTNRDTPRSDLVPPVRYDERLLYMLDEIREVVPYDIGCVYTQSREVNQHEAVAVRTTKQVTSADWGTVERWVQTQVKLLTPHHQVSSFSMQPQQVGRVKNVLLWPLIALGEVIGGVVLLSYGPVKYSDEDIHQLDTLIHLIQAVVENRNMRERLITTEAIGMTAQAIARNPSPQNIVHVLRDYLFDVHISSCVIGLFGPVTPEHPTGPFEYIEIKGSWSRRLGSKVGVNVRFDLRNYEDILKVLYEQKIITLQNIDDYITAQTDEFTKMMLQIDRVQSMTLILLQSEQSQLGIIAITTDIAHELAPQELRAYQIVSEFLTMSTMAEALRQQADFIMQGRAALLDAVNDGVMMVLPDEAASVLTLNDHFTHMFGLRVSEVQGISLYNLLERMQIPASVRRDLSDQWKDDPAQARSVHLEGEFQMTGMEGARHDIQWYSAPVYKDEQILGRIFTFHDITPERTSERLRSELLSRISHELRTPLTSIRGFAQFILEVAGDDLPDVAREYTEIIHSSAIHLNHLFTDMIELTRANAGELKMSMASREVQQIVRDVVKRMTPQSLERGHTIVAEIDDAIPPVHMDVDRVVQVVTNLVSNAIKYAPDNTNIFVKVRYIPNDQKLPRSAPADIITPCALISVIDEGQGLSAEEIEKIFLPFYRTSASRAGKIEGAGLGLAIAHSIVELHRGAIWAEASKRKQPGGRFFFTIPTVEYK